MTPKQNGSLRTLKNITLHREQNRETKFCQETKKEQQEQDTKNTKNKKPTDPSAPLGSVGWTNRRVVLIKIFLARFWLFCIPDESNRLKTTQYAFFLTELIVVIVILHFEKLRNLKWRWLYSILVNNTKYSQLIQSRHDL